MLSILLQTKSIYKPETNGKSSNKKKAHKQYYDRDLYNRTIKTRAN